MPASYPAFPPTSPRTRAAAFLQILLTVPSNHVARTSAKGGIPPKQHRAATGVRHGFVHPGDSVLCCLPRHSNEGNGLMSAAPDRPLQLLASPVRRAIVDMLANLSDADQLGLTATDLGEQLHIHPTTARFHLDQLETHGLVASYFQRGRV